MEASVRGIPVHYEVRGEGRPLLVLHGFGADHRFGLHHYEALFAQRPGWKRIYPDLPGMGQTPGAPWITRPDDVLDLVLDFVDGVVGDEPLTAIGISWGGYIVTGIARRRPETLSGIMLTAPVVHGEGAARDIPPRVILQHDPTVDGMLEPSEGPWTQLSVIQTPAALTTFRAAVKPGLMVADWPFLRTLAPRYDPSIVEERLPAPMPAPALVLTGRHDVAVGYRDAWPLMADLPRGTYVVLDGAGHGVEEEQKALFHVLAGEWLDRVEAWTPAQP